MTKQLEAKDGAPTSDKSTNTGFKHLMNASQFSILGLKAACQHQSAFRQELAILALLTPLALWATASWLQFAVLFSAMCLVLAVELLNSAIEAAMDRMSTEYHPMAGLAKDYGSAAVMISLIIAGSLWLGVLADRFL